MAGERRPLMAAVDDEIVALGLARDRFRYGGIEQVVAFGGAQRGAQIGGVFLTGTVSKSQMITLAPMCPLNELAAYKSIP
jgi:hypothetical protein